MTSRLSLLTFLLCSSWLAQAALLLPSPPSLGANSYILMDYKTSRILAEEKPDTQVEPASITKIMTAYVLFHELKSGRVKLDDPVTISKKAWQTPGSRSFVEVGKQVPLETLLKGMIIQSGNDASVALAEYTAGSEEAFASLMNQYADVLGMKNSHFVNATGLPAEGHLTTARDVALLSQALISEFPEYYAWFKQKEMTYNNIRQQNRNILLWRDPAVDGIKTGHTESAGYCLAATGLRNGMRLISVVMGSRTEKGRADDSQSLLGYGFRFFETRELYQPGQAITESTIWKSPEGELQLGLAETLEVTIPRGSYEALDAKIEIPETLVAPVEKGEKVGVLKVMLKDSLIAERDLIALEPAPLAGFWKRTIDGLKLKTGIGLD